MRRITRLTWSSFNITGKEGRFSVKDVGRHGHGSAGELEDGRVAEDDWDHPSPINESSRSVSVFDFLPVCGGASGDGRWSSVVRVGFVEMGSKVFRWCYMESSTCSC